MNKSWKITVIPNTNALGGVRVRTLSRAGDDFAERVSKAIEEAVREIVQQRKEAQEAEEVGAASL